MMSAALTVGIGVGVGIGLASGGGFSSNRLTPQVMEKEMINLLVDGKDTKVTFDQFPYYLR